MYDDQTEFNWTKAIGGGVAGGGANLITGLYSEFNPTTRKYGKLKNSYNRQMAQAALENAILQKEQYMDQSARNEQELQQSLYGRGLGKSSIATEDTDFFNRAKSRAIAQMDANISGAQARKRLVDYEIRANRLNTYMGYVNSLLGMAGGMIAAGA